MQCVQFQAAETTRLLEILLNEIEKPNRPGQQLVIGDGNVIGNVRPTQVNIHMILYLGLAQAGGLVLTLAKLVNSLVS